MGLNGRENIEGKSTKCCGIEGLKKGEFKGKEGAHFSIGEVKKGISGGTQNQLLIAERCLLEPGNLGKIRGCQRKIRGKFRGETPKKKP